MSYAWRLNFGMRFWSNARFLKRVRVPRCGDHANAFQVREAGSLQTGNQKSAPKNQTALIVFQTAPRQIAEFLISINEFFIQTSDEKRGESGPLRDGAHSGRGRGCHRRAELISTGFWRLTFTRRGWVSCRERESPPHDRAAPAFEQKTVARA